LNWVTKGSNENEIQSVGRVGRREKKGEGDVTLILRLFTYDVIGALHANRVCDRATKVPQYL
jgi:hypothetical protein